LFHLLAWHTTHLCFSSTCSLKRTVQFCIRCIQFSTSGLLLSQCEKLGNWSWSIVISFHLTDMPFIQLLIIFIYFTKATFFQFIIYFCMLITSSCPCSLDWSRSNSRWSSVFFTVISIHLGDAICVELLIISMFIKATFIGFNITIYICMMVSFCSPCSPNWSRTSSCGSRTTGRPTSFPWYMFSMRSYNLLFRMLVIQRLAFYLLKHVIKEKI
jgi:hypothetical protein